MKWLNKMTTNTQILVLDNEYVNESMVLKTNNGCRAVRMKCVKLIRYRKCD